METNSEKEAAMDTTEKQENTENTNSASDFEDEDECENESSTEEWELIESGEDESSEEIETDKGDKDNDEDNPEAPNVVCYCHIEGRQTGGCKRRNQQPEAGNPGYTGARYGRMLDKQATRELKNTTKINDQPLIVSPRSFIPPDDFKGHQMVKLSQMQGCPYIDLGIMGQPFKSLIDSGAGISIISQLTASKIKQTDMWKKAESQGEARHNERIKVNAVSCNGDKIAIVGRITLPSMHINMIEIPVKVSFWVMTQPTDG